ncbi:O-antigen ligase family protein [Butyrivibrio sp.]|jgi:hypothetical protein|uniref:O-antigen ligase family protein n=1 Tax=Butyrivibrio sp. TaxID=28121 RepID=UPI0025C152DB|nr:O-antigen ligase family protein [Butyrivibrio sp.]MBE5838010.1 O-antigen ligase family protein [Butyrivibrio sp.]
MISILSSPTVITKRKYSIYVAMLMVLIWILCGGGNVNVAIALLVITSMFSFSTKIEIENKMIFIYLVFILYSIIITAFFWDDNIDKSLSAHQLAKYILILLGTFLTYRKIDFESFLVTLRNAGIFLVIFACIEGIVGTNYLALIISGNSVSYENGQRAYSIFNHPLLAISFYIFFLLLVLLFPFKKRVFQYFFVSSCILAILYNRSRSGWLALLVLCFIYGIKFRHFIMNEVIKITSRHSKNRVVFGGLVVATLLGSEVLGRGILSSFFQVISKRFKGSFEAGIGKIVRLETIESSIKYWITENHIMEMIFGMGKNADRAFLQKHPVVKGNWVWNYAIDNQYITWIHESGLLGMCFMLVILIMSIQRFFRCNSSNKCGMLANSMIIALMISAFFYEMFNYQIMVSFFCLFLTLSEVTWLQD